jgi:hypothetical protein
LLGGLLITSVRSDEVYRPRPGEAYNPEAYCNWTRTGLPPAQQKICSDHDNKFGVYVSKWQTIEAANGAVYKVDVNSIKHYNNGNAEIVVYAVEGEAFNPMNMTRFIFACDSHHYMDVSNFGVWIYAPPRSVAGQIENLACAEEAPKASDYCTGFSSEACHRIKTVIETKVRPEYCKPGFGLVGSGLTAEQLRICYVMAAPGFR